MIYLDNAGTTAVYEEVIEKMSAVYRKDYFNPSATHMGGRIAKDWVEDSRKILAQKLNCNKEEVYFTSCATESNNWILNSGFKNKKGNIVVSSGEHACIYETAKNLQSKGFDVRFVPLQEDGTVNPAEVAKSVDEKTNLVSVIHVSNETGAVNDLAAISHTVKAKNPRVIVHSDGVQAFLKIPTSMKHLGIDCYSLSGHKIGAPKGIGLLYIRSGVHLAPYLYGGGQEKGLRSGTENVGGIVGFAAAAQAFSSQFHADAVKEIHSHLISLLQSVPDVTIIGNQEKSNRMIVCAGIDGVRAETVQSVLSDHGIYIGRGSACSSRHSGNRVLSEMGISQSLIEGAVRFSISPSTTKEELEIAVTALKEVIHHLRGHNIG